MKRFVTEQFLRPGLALLGTVVFSTLVAGCADAPPASDPEAVAEYKRANDPLEPWNRGVYGVNTVFDKAVFKPAAERYRDHVPEYVRDRIHSFLVNLRSPVVLANDLLQLDAVGASYTFSRFMVNTTVGLVGMYDPAADFAPHHDNDLGKTFGTWGVGEGPYLVLPLLGPSNPRDAVGFGVESYFDPLDRYASNMGYDYTTYVQAVLVGVNRRVDNLDNLDEIERTSIDPYSTMRSMYRQYRQSLIGGKPVADKPRPGLTGTFPNDSELSQRD